MSFYSYYGLAEHHETETKAHIQIEYGHTVPDDKITEAFEAKVAEGLRGEFRLFFKASGEIFSFQL